MVYCEILQCLTREKQTKKDDDCNHDDGVNGNDNNDEKDEKDDDDSIDYDDDGTLWNLSNVNQGKSGQLVSCLLLSTINCGGKIMTII